MPVFTKPLDFTQVRGEVYDSISPLSITDITSILAEHVRAYLADPTAFSGLPYEQSMLLHASTDVYLEPAELAKAAVTDWVLVLPQDIQQEQLMDMGSAGLRIYNSAAPGSSKTAFNTAVGSMPSKETTILTRSVMLAVSALSVPAAFRFADSLYMWLVAMAPILRLEFGCSRVNVLPAKAVTEAERFAFQGVAGNPVVMGIAVVSQATFTYSNPDPV